MSIKKEYRYRSLGGLADIYAKSLCPENGNPKAVFQICHGMAEHCERYNDFAEYLCSQGFCVFIHDHLGHGKSVKNDDMLGYFGENKGWNCFVEDARSLTQIAKKEYPTLPVIFFGHSMGSFVAREYARRYGNDSRILGFIFCGTSGSNPAAPAGIALAKAVAKFKGSRHRSKLIDGIAFGTYNKKCVPCRTSFDWLTRDGEIVDKYVADKYCGFLFTARGYCDMFTLLKTVSGKNWYAGLNRNKPVLLVCGGMDPVGNYGKGVMQVYNNLRANGVDVSLRIFENARHEILNETNRAETYQFVANWAKAKAKITE